MLLLNKSISLRKTASTKCNRDSSRSHFFVIFNVNKDGLSGNILIADLAGSENLIKTAAEGEIAKEGV